MCMDDKWVYVNICMYECMHTWILSTCICRKVYVHEYACEFGVYTDMTVLVHASLYRNPIENQMSKKVCMKIWYVGRIFMMTLLLIWARKL